MHDLARRLLSARERAAERDAVRPEGERLHQAAVAADPAVRNEREVRAHRGPALDQRLELGDAEARIDPRRAAAAAERLDRLLHHDRVAVGDVDHDEIDASADELGLPLEIVALGANGGAHVTGTGRSPPSPSLFLPSPSSKERSEDSVRKDPKTCPKWLFL